MNVDDIHGMIGEGVVLEDQTVVGTGGGDFERHMIPIGQHYCRLVGYVELGEQPQKPYQGKEKPPADMVELTFQFVSKRAAIKKEDGTVIYPTRRIRIKKSLHEKAGYRKLFDKLRGGDTSITHMAQMIAKKAWAIRVNWRANGADITTKKKGEEALEAHKNEKDEKKKKELRVWESLRNDGGYMFSAPVKPVLDEDGEDTGEVEPVKVPAHDGDLKLFLWDNPNEAMWASIFIEGEWDRKDDSGKEIKVSKNVVQNTIIAATNFEGSPVQAMLGGVDDVPVDDAVVEEEEEAPEEKPVEKKADKAPKAEEAPEEEADPLDELGI